jgi:threonine/homoserine/homoserine lactone efflux protein
MAGERDVSTEAASPWRLFAAGFVVNFVNPFVFTFWIGAIGGLTVRHGLGVATVVGFFGGVVTTIFATDLLKARLAHSLRAHLRGRAARWIQRLSGVALAGFGVFMLGDAVAKIPEVWGGAP